MAEVQPTKKCTKCKRGIPEVTFMHDAGNRDGWSSRCCECRRAQCRQYYHKDLARSRARVRKSLAAARKRDPAGMNARNRAWKRAHPETTRRGRMRRFGWTPEAYDAMYAAQGGVCAICGQPESVIYLGKIKPLAVDHDHATERVRGLLCQHCNQGLGSFRDDRVRLLSAVRYLDTAVKKDVA